MLFTFMLHSQLPYKPQEQHSVLILPSFSCEDKHDYFFLYVQGLLCLTVSPFMVSTYVIILCSCTCSCLPALSFFWLSFHFPRGQNRKSRSSVFLCSETKVKRLVFRLTCFKNTVNNNYLTEGTKRITACIASLASEH